MPQSAIVAFIVIAAFGVGVMTGRAMNVPGSQPAPVAQVQPPAAPAPAFNFPPSAPMIPSRGGGEAGLPSGTIAEVMQVPNYTYLRLTTTKGEVWAAVNSNPALAVGQQVAMSTASKMEGFNSKTLNRTFDEIWFGALAE